MRKPSWRPALVVLLALSLVIISPALAKKKKKEKESVPEGPRIKMVVSTHHGFIPLNITLSASLDGIEITDQQFCHAGVEWESTSPYGLTSTSKQDPRCLHPPEETEIKLTYTKNVTLRRPGLYRYRLILHKRNGEILYSNTQEVRAIVGG